MGGMVDNGAIDPMKECPTMARGLLMLSPLPNLMLSLLPRLMLIPSMIMDTTLDTMACLPVDTVDNGATTLDTISCLTMVMVENRATMDTTLDPMAGLTMDMVDNGVTDPMEECSTMARGLLMLSPLPRLMLSLLPRLMLIPSMIMDTTLDTMACLTMVMVNNGATMDTILDPMAGHTMDMVDNGVTDPMKECSTMARGLLMLSPLPRLMLI